MNLRSSLCHIRCNRRDVRLITRHSSCKVNSSNTAKGRRSSPRPKKNAPRITLRVDLGNLRSQQPPCGTAAEALCYESNNRSLPLHWEFMSFTNGRRHCQCATSKMESLFCMDKTRELCASEGETGFEGNWYYTFRPIQADR